MKTLAFASMLLVACTSPSPPKEVGREATAPTTSVTVEPAATTPSVERVAPGAGSPSAGVKCGEVTCAPGQVCCNASCGICTPPDGACIQMACEPKKDAGPLTGPPSLPSASGCTTDADCRLHESYCPDTPCACFALGPRSAAPSCTKPSVNCFVAPCMKKVARCEAGKCVVSSP